MHTRKLTLFALIMIVTAVVAVAGCADKTTYAYGVVGWNKEFSIGSFAPDIPITLANGEQSTLHEVREPVAILAFVNPWTDACCKLRPDLLSFRKQFNVKPVSVVQILLPVGGYTYGSGCMPVSNFDQYDIVSLYDTDRVAWRSYNQPDPNTVILVDENSKIVDIENTDNLRVLADKVYWMARTIDDRGFEAGD